MNQKALYFFEFFDLFSQTPSLKINGNNRLKTNFGAVIGIFSIIILITGISFILSEYFLNLSLNVYSYVDNSKDPDIDISKLKMSFLITDLMGREFEEPERLFSIEAKHWDFFIPEDGNKTRQAIKIQNLKKIKCNEYVNNDLMDSKFEKFSKLHNVTCLDFKSLGKNLKGVHLNSER